MNDDIVLATLQGEPIVTAKSLQEEKNALLQAHPGINIPEEVLNSKGFERKLLWDMVNQILIDKYVIAHKINETEAYKKDLDAAIKNSIRAVNMKYFNATKESSVSDDEIKAFYDAKREENPEYISFEQLKTHGDFDFIKAELKKEVDEYKKFEFLNQEIEKLREKYHVQTNEDYFKPYDED